MKIESLTGKWYFKQNWFGSYNLYVQINSIKRDGNGVFNDITYRKGTLADMNQLQIMHDKKVITSEN